MRYKIPHEVISKARFDLRKLFLHPMGLKNGLITDRPIEDKSIAWTEYANT